MPSLAGLVRRVWGGHLALPLLQPLGDLPVESLHPDGEGEGVLTELTVLAVLTVVGEVTQRTGDAGSIARIVSSRWRTVAGPHPHQTAAQYRARDAGVLARTRCRVAAVEAVILTGG